MFTTHDMVLTRIAQALRGKADSVLAGGKLGVDGVDVTAYIDVNREYSHYGLLGKPNGKYRVVVHMPRYTKSFPQRKDGSFAYDKIADLVVEMARGLKQSEADADVRSANQAAVDTVRDKAGYVAGLSVLASSSTEFPVRLALTRNVTVGQALAIAELLRLSPR